MDIIQAQLDETVGIFACEDTAVVSDINLDLGRSVETIAIDMVDGGTSRDGTAANTQTFINAWMEVTKDGRFQHYDFTVKTDPDTVLLPERLRVHLKGINGDNIYLANCDRRDIWPGSPDYPMMNGALEVVSTAAVM